jgi:hypothetical protein
LVKKHFSETMFDRHTHSFSMFRQTLVELFQFACVDQMSVGQMVFGQKRWRRFCEDEARIRLKFAASHIPTIFVSTIYLIR